MSKQMTADDKAVATGIQLDAKILVELRAAAKHLAKVQQLVAKAEGNKYAFVNDILSNAANYDFRDLLVTPLEYIEVLGGKLYADIETPGPFVDGKRLSDVKDATDAQTEAAYDEWFHMKELWQERWIKGTRPNAMEVTEHLDVLLDEREQGPPAEAVPTIAIAV